MINLQAMGQAQPQEPPPYLMSVSNTRNPILNRTFEMVFKYSGGSPNLVLNYGATMPKG